MVMVHASESVVSLDAPRARPRPPGHPESTRWFLTLHVLERMHERGVTRDEVLTTLNSPQNIRPMDGGRQMAVSGRLGVVFDNDIVITVVWNRGID